LRCQSRRRNEPGQEAITYVGIDAHKKNLTKVDGDVRCLSADPAYDTLGIYEAAGARGATVVIPPTIRPRQM